MCYSAVVWAARGTRNHVKKALVGANYDLISHGIELILVKPLCSKQSPLFIFFLFLNIVELFFINETKLGLFLYMLVCKKRSSSSPSAKN